MDWILSFYSDFIAWVFMTVTSHDTHALSYPYGKMKENFLDIR